MPRALTNARSVSQILRSRRFQTLAIFTAVLGGALLTSSPAMANCCTIKAGGSPNANSISTLYNIVFGIAIFVFVAVDGVLLYCVWKFRAKKNPNPLQTHGNVKVELGLTASAALILVILAVATFVELPSIINPPNSNAGPASVLSASLTAPTPPSGKHLTICVTARQFIWRYTYGAGCNKDSWAERLPYSYQEMEVPAGVTVDLVSQSIDVIHSWWIPRLGGKVDAVPGFTTYTWFKALHSGQTYLGQCAQLCGRQHAFMTAQVKVVTPAQYESWLATQGKLITDQNDQVPELRAELIKDQQLTSNGIF
jgi:cytochrome c oxidase subunit 2